MRIFGAALGCELRKLAARKKYIVFLIIAVLICAFTLLLQVLLSRLTGGALRVGVFGMTFGMLGFFIRFYIPLIMFMAVCDLFQGEQHDGSLRAALLRPVSRFKLYAAKTGAAFIMSACYLAALFLVTAVLELSTGGKLYTVWTGLWSYVLDVAPLALLVLMAALICQLVPGFTLAYLVCIVVYAALAILGAFVPQLGSMLFTSYSSWHNLWIGSTLPFMSLLPKIALLAGYGTVMFTGGYLLFDRKDF